MIAFFSFLSLPQLRLYPGLSALGLSTSKQRHLNLGSGKLLGVFGCHVGSGNNVSIFTQVNDYYWCSHPYRFSRILVLFLHALPQSILN